MDEKKGNGGVKHALTSRSALAVAIVSAVLGSTGGPLLLVKLGGPNFFAPDRFTGTDGKVFEKRLADTEALVARHVNEHPDVELRASIAALSSQVAAANARQDLIIQNQNRILTRLDNIR